MTYAETTVIIPTLNEEKNIGRLVDLLKTDYLNIKIIVADDGSSDQTLALAQKHGAYVLDRKNEKIKGISAAVVDALNLVQTENLIVMDADFQHLPEKISEIVEKLKENDLVIGTRETVPETWPWLRKFQSKIAISLANLRLKQKITDPVSGFFGIKTELFKQIKKDNFELRCFKILFNILKNIKSPEIKIAEVNYSFNLRELGQSKLSQKHIRYFLKNLLK